MLLYLQGLLYPPSFSSGTHFGAIQLDTALDANLACIQLSPVFIDNQVLYQLAMGSSLRKAVNHNKMVGLGKLKQYLSLGELEGMDLKHLQAYTFSMMGKPLNPAKGLTAFERTPGMPVGWPLWASTCNCCFEHVFLAHASSHACRQVTMSPMQSNKTPKCCNAVRVTLPRVWFIMLY